MKRSPFYGVDDLAISKVCIEASKKKNEMIDHLAFVQR